jgi:hypothetical protein
MPLSRGFSPGGVLMIAVAPLIIAVMPEGPHSVRRALSYVFSHYELEECEAGRDRCVKLKRAYIVFDCL